MAAVAAAPGRRRLGWARADVPPGILVDLTAIEPPPIRTLLANDLGAVDDVRLPPASIDAALMVDAYHEFDHPAEMLASLRSALKPKGRIYLLEFRAEDEDVPIKPHHKMTEAQARKELEAAGFRFVTNKPGLPWQHLLIFEKP